MPHVVVLLLSSVLIIFLAILIYTKTRNISLIAGIFFIYYFTLLGGVVIVLDKINNDMFKDVGMNYYYLFDKMYDIYLDEDYLFALIIYSLFILTIELTLLLFTKTGKVSDYLFRANRIRISHYKLIILCFVFFLVSLFITGSYLVEAFASGTAAYTLIRYSEEAIPFYTIHQIFIRMAVFSLPIGIVVQLSGNNGKFFIAEDSKYAPLLYSVLGCALLIYLALLGNRNELMVAMSTGILFFFANNNKKIGLLKTILVMMLFLSILGVIAAMRGTNPMEYGSSLSPEFILGGVLNAVTSNEIIAAHMSMYGALRFDIPLVYGSSLISLIASVIPIIFWPGRPQDIYWHYFNHIPATPGQGYVIHHATGWYLNFGIIGVVIGSIVIGVLWSKCYNSVWYINKSSRNYINILRVLSPYLFVGAMLPLLRGGLEGYKAVVIEHFIIPILVVSWSCLKHEKDSP